MRQFKHGASSQRQHYSFSPEWPDDATGDLPAPLLESPDSQIGHELVLYQVDLLLICSPRFILFYLILLFRVFVSLSILLFSLSLLSLPLTLTGSPVSIVALFRETTPQISRSHLSPFSLISISHLDFDHSSKGEMRSNGSSSRILSSPGSTNGPASPHGSSDTKLTAFSPEDVRSRGRSESSVDAPLNDGGFCRLYSL